MSEYNIKKNTVTMTWNTSKMISFILAVVVYLWLMILAYGSFKGLEGGWRTYALITFIVGTLAAAGLLVTIAYANDK